jgi:hypothetical protein
MHYEAKERLPQFFLMAGQQRSTLVSDEKCRLPHVLDAIHHSFRTWNPDSFSRFATIFIIL